jgi:hypothetical protein
MKTKDIFLWFLFMLLASAISCIFNAIASNSSKKLEENKEANMNNKIIDIFTEKTNEIKNFYIGEAGKINNFFTEGASEIKNEIKIALGQNDLFSGEQNNIINILMTRSLDIGKIERIKILAHNSNTFFDSFTTYCNEKEFKCKELNILVHKQDINENSKVVTDWVSLYKNKEIDTIMIRKAIIYRRSFFGMIIEFENNRPIGLIGFYEPDHDQVIPFDKRHGVFSEDNFILDVLDEYFKYYFDNRNNSTLLCHETKNKDDD